MTLRCDKNALVGLIAVVRRDVDNCYRRSNVECRFLVCLMSFETLNGVGPGIYVLDGGSRSTHAKGQF